MRIVEFRSGDLTISGQLYLPDPIRFTPPFPGVVVCHGIGSRKENQASFDTYLAAHGFAVLGFDFRGHGSSQGRLDEGTLDDVQGALDFIAAQPQVDANRLALRGSSMGGMFALRAAAIDQRVRLFQSRGAHESTPHYSSFEIQLRHSVDQGASLEE